MKLKLFKKSKAVLVSCLLLAGANNAMAGEGAVTAEIGTYGALIATDVGIATGMIAGSAAVGAATGGALVGAGAVAYGAYKVGMTMSCEVGCSAQKCANDPDYVARCKYNCGGPYIQNCLKAAAHTQYRKGTLSNLFKGYVGNDISKIYLQPNQAKAWQVTHPTPQPVR